MVKSSIWVMVAVVLVGPGVLAQTGADPFPAPIESAEGIVRVNIAEFASLPGIAGEAARMMLLIDEPSTRRLFVNDMRGPLYGVSYDGVAVRQYLDVNAERWGVRVQSMGRERGFQSFAFHPQFNLPGTRGFGKFYTYTDTSNMTPTPDFTPGGDMATHDTVLLEWTAQAPGATAYDGGPPRELVRLRQPFANHNAGHLAFNPLASPGSADFGLLYMGVADGGSGGDPLGLGQNLGSAFGKILRIDPLGDDSANGQYGIPPGNPFVNDGNSGTLGEIYAYGVRNPQRFGWDPRNGNLFLAEIGQNIVEEISLVTAGANLGWNRWEGSFAFISRTEISLDNQRGDSDVTYPVVEYAHIDPLLLDRSSITGVVVYRATTIPQLTNLVLFGDIPSGEVFYFNADALPRGGQDAIRRVLFTDNGSPKTLLQIIGERTSPGTPPPARVDLRFGTGPGGQVFLLNKHDGVIRVLVP